jgi:signal transduction histidine kinase
MRDVGVWRRAGALRLVAAFAVVGLLALAMLAWVTLTLSDRAVREQAEARVQSTSSAAADLVHQQLRGLGGVVEIVSRRPPVIDALAARQTDSPDLLRAAIDIRSTVNVESAAVFDATGHLLAADPPSAGVPLGTDLSFRDWFVGARRSSGYYISEAYVSRATPPQQLVTASAAVRDGSNRIVGIVTASYSVPALQREFDAFARSQRVQLQVTDQRGIVISGPAYRGSLEIDRNGDVTEALVGQTTLVRSGEDLRASAPVPDIGWTVTAIAPTSRVDVPIAELRRGVLAIAGLLAVAMLGGLMLMTWTVRRGQRAERVAATAEARQRLLLESTGDGVVGIDRGGRCTFANPAAARLLGVPSPEALLGEDVHAGIREVEETVEWDSHPLVEDGEVTGAVVTLRDLSERRRAERELAAARDAALEASRMKSAFLANMSHEIRTPLNGVIGMTSLLADTSLDERQREYVDTIRASSDALLDVINDILDFSKIEAGRLDIEEIDYDVREVVEQVADMLAPAAHRKGVELILDLRDEIGRAHV